MTVVSSIISTVKPGRFEDMVAMAHEAEKAFERHGASAVRLLAAAAAGEAAGNVTLAVEYDDLDAWGRAADESMADPDVLSLIARVRSAESPVTITQQSLAVELPERAAKPGRGNVVEIFVSRITPGCFERATADGLTACEVVERAGAVNARIYTLPYAGMGSGLAMFSAEYPNMTTFAGAQKAWQTDPEGLRLAGEMNGATPSVTPVFAALYTVIPL